MPLSPTATRELLDRLSHRPKRFLGQNFLVDGNIVRKSLALGEVAAGDRIVEIGPGLGTLTEALLDAGAEVWAVEKDRTLHAHLVETLVPRFSERLHLMEGDAVEQPLAGLPAGDARLGFKIIANLPYAISTPWMEGVLGGPLPDRMVLMLQLEAAQRYAAQPGTKQFSAISVFLQSAYHIAPGHRVAAACFHPKPDVDSFLFHLVRQPAPFIFQAPARALIRACFQQRRKQISGLLHDKLPDHGAAWLTRLAAAGLPAQTRPEAIPASLWQALEASLRGQAPTI
jgi:16S rRNA (adenine1518-N6/adenine1519-N6)-dimethyltransferase